MLEVRLLGQFDVRRDGTAIVIPSRAGQSLLAFLLLTAGTMHRREKLAGQLWPDTTDDNARKNLRHELWRMRKTLETKTRRKGAEPFIAVDDISIGFNAASDLWLDVALLQQALGEKTSPDDLMQTVSLYRGELLPGLYDDWVALERERVRAAFEQKMAKLLELLVQVERWPETLEWGERWIALGQTPEPAYRALMLAHSALGNVSQVAFVYERCVHALRDQLGVEPSRQTRDLFDRLSKSPQTTRPTLPHAATSTRQFMVTAPDPAPAKLAPEPPREHAPLLSIARRPRSGNVPVPLTSFIGREREIRELKDALAAARLLTLIGAGGMGKTRLAIQLASKLTDEYTDGVWWVNLVPLSDPALVPQAVASVFGLREAPGVSLLDTLADALCSKHILLVLDNCEHLVTACAQLAEVLLASCASLAVLTTSREALGISGETIWRVPSLSIPGPEQSLAPKDLDRFESIRLFADRSHAANSTFSLTEENALAIVHICQRLDGIPLAIELAAARVKTLSVQQIAARLDDRLGLLTQGSRTALPRHQTLRATIDWSYDLLSEQEKTFFRRLSVFAGGWTFEASEAVCTGDGIEKQAVLELLTRLVDKSLVIVEEQQGASRYRMLETIREYAGEKLDETEEENRVQRRHLEFFLKLTEEIEPRLFHFEQSSLLDQLELEIDNLRACVDWAIENQHVISALRLVSAIPRFWFIRAHHNEGLERLRGILGLPEAMRPSATRLKALNAYLFMLWPSGQLAEFQPLIEEALALGKTFKDDWNTAYALLWLGVCQTIRGEYAKALEHLEESFQMFRTVGDATYSAWALVFLGEVELLRGGIARAQALYEQAIAELKESKDYPFLAIPLRRVGQLALSRGDLATAATFIRESLTENWSVRDYRGVAACLAAFGELNIAQRQLKRAILLYAAAASILDFIRTPLLPFDGQQYDRNLAALRANYGPATFDAAWADGYAMSMEQAISYALNSEDDRPKS